MTPGFLKDWAPIAISLVALMLSVFTLGWNVYRDVILKARVRVRFAVIRVLTYGDRIDQGPQYLQIAATNHGPGPVRVEMIVGRTAPLWRKILRRVENFVILIDHTNPLNPKLPHRIEVGDTVNLFLPYNVDSFLNGTGTHIGVSDSFGRTHFAPRKNITEARDQFRKDFSSAISRKHP